MSPNKNTKVSSSQQLPYVIRSCQNFMWPNLHLHSSVNRLMLHIHPVSRAATLCPATPPAQLTAMRSGTKSAPVQECGATLSSTTTCRAPPLTAASTPPPLPPPKAAQRLLLEPSGPRKRYHGRKIQAAREAPTLHLRHLTLLSPLGAMRSRRKARPPFHWIQIVVPTT